jgi:hypothetical protein
MRTAPFGTETTYSWGGIQVVQSIPEADWKVFRELREVALDRFCQRVLAEIESAATDETRTNHIRYRAVYDLIHRRDRELAAAFDSPRRSQAMIQLMQIYSLELLTAEEMDRFSAETRAAVHFLAGDET